MRSRRLAAILPLAFVLAACASSTESATAPAAVEPEPTVVVPLPPAEPTPTPVAEPTPAPAPATPTPSAATKRTTTSPARSQPSKAPAKKATKAATPKPTATKKPATKKTTTKKTSTTKTSTKKKTTTTTKAPSGLAGQIIAQTNAVRKSKGLPALKSSSCLSSSAASWAASLDKNDSFAHTSLSGVLSKCGYTYAAENLAMTGPSSSAAKIVDLWMNSSGHRANLLSEKAGLIGVAVVHDASRDSLIIVQQFGRS